MVSERIEYICKKCGWRKSILAAWADLRPKKCMNKKCSCSFILEPEMLGIQVPEIKEPKEEPRAEEQPKKNFQSRRR